MKENKSNMISDVIIIGAGAVGGAAARMLSRYELKIVCLEKEADVCCGISKANTGIIHSPALVHYGTVKSEYTARSNGLFEKLSLELGFQFQRTGALVLGFSEDDRKTLESYKEQGEKAWKNCPIMHQPFPEYRIIEKEELKDIEPGLNPDVLFALHTPEAGRIIPYEYGTALWENAVENQVDLKLNTEVKKISRIREQGTDLWRIDTEKQTFKSKYLINAAGHGSVALGIKAGFKDHKVSRVKGQYIILDRRKSPEISHILFQAPARGKSGLGKGILVTNTIYGNLMIGPDARWIDQEEGSGTDMESLKEVLKGAFQSCPGINPRFAIKTFAGIRPKPEGGDFIIEEKDGFINLCGIESPGLTSSPAIAEDTVKILQNAGLILIEKTGFKAERKPIVDIVYNYDMSEAGKMVNLPDDDPEKLICRCEQVPSERIKDALNRGIPVTTVDGVKRRTRAGQGSCQGNFCGNRVRRLISEKFGIPEKEISERGNEPDYPRITPDEIRKAFPGK